MFDNKKTSWRHFNQRYNNEQAACFTLYSNIQPTADIHLPAPVALRGVLVLGRIASAGIAWSRLHPAGMPQPQLFANFQPNAMSGQLDHLPALLRWSSLAGPRSRRVWSRRGLDAQWSVVRLTTAVAARKLLQANGF